MRYSVFAGGKRLRALLCMAAADAAGGARGGALLPAAAVEALHTASLVHDDLPFLDDDALRRGKPACHVVFGPSIALLAGDALVFAAFGWLARCAPPPPVTSNQLTLELAAAAGSGGMTGGQVADLCAEATEPSPDLVDFIHRRKTASLFRASVRIGAMCAGCAWERLEVLGEYGESLGLAFQILDDLQNHTAEPGSIGKPVRTDEHRRKATSVAAFGARGAALRGRRLVSRAIDCLRPLGPAAAVLAAVAQHVSSQFAYATDTAGLFHARPADATLCQGPT